MNKKIIKIGLLFIFSVSIFFTFKFLFSTYTSKNIISTNSIAKENIYSFSTLDSNTLNIKLLETKFNAKKTIKGGNLDIFNNMLEAIDKSERISNPNIITESLFKIYISDSKEKYVLDLYGDDILAIYPWDGSTQKEFVSVKKLPNSLNPESICNYIFKN